MFAYVTSSRERGLRQFATLVICFAFLLSAGCGSSKPPETKKTTKPAAKDSAKPSSKPAATSGAKPASTAATKPAGSSSSLPPGTGAAPAASPAGGVAEIKSPIVIKSDKRMTSLAFLPDGRIATAGENGADLWNPANPAEKKPLVVEGNPVKASRVAVSPDGKQLAVGGYTGDVYFYSLPAGEYSHKLDEPSLFMQGLAFTPKGDILACTHDQQQIMLFNLADKKLLAKIGPEKDSQCRGLAFSHDGALVFGLWRKQLLAWDVATQQVKKDVPFPSADQFKGFDTLAASPTTPELVVAGNANTVVFVGEVWSTATWAPAGKLDQANDESFAKYAYSPDGKSIGGAGSLGDCAVWNAATRKKTMKLKEGTGAVNAVAFSRDGKMFATAGGENEICVWKLP